MRKALRPRAQPERGEFGSEIAKELGLRADEVAAIVGSIVGGAAAAFVIGRFQGDAWLPFLVCERGQINCLSDDLLVAGAQTVLVALPRDVAVSPAEKSEEFAGVRFLIRTPITGKVKRARPMKRKERIS